MRIGTRLAVRLRKLIWIVAVGTSVGLGVGALRTLLGSSSAPWGGLALGFSIAAVVGAADVFFMADAARRLSFAVGILVRTLGHAALVLATFAVVSRLFAEEIAQRGRSNVALMVGGISAACILFGTSVQRVRRLLGGRELLHFVTGRYHRPVEETRVFLFLDLVSSTTIAERIGHLQFYRLVREFFFDITEPILESRGEIYKYVGDEVIVVWTLEDAVAEARCARCAFAMVDAIERQRDKYEQSFGVVPSFRVGLHVGPVVTGEIGDDRQEIAFLGDTVNTAARIQAECKAVGRWLLLSAELLEKLELPAWMKSERVGTVQLRGKDRGVDLFALDRAA